MEKCRYALQFLEETKRYRELEIWDEKATVELRAIARCYLGKPNLCYWLKTNMEGLIYLSDVLLALEMPGPLIVLKQFEN
jgi:hypothetical protein